MTKYLWHRKITQVGAFFLALLISIVLLIAGIGKLAFPSKIFFPFFDRLSAVLELIWIFFLLRYHNHWQMWLTNAFLFFFWTGYTLFWLMLDLPCGCFGSWTTKPTSLFISLDGIYIILSLIFAYILGEKGTHALMSGVIGILFGSCGFMIGLFIFQGTQ